MATNGGSQQAGVLALGPKKKDDAKLGSLWGHRIQETAT